MLRVDLGQLRREGSVLVEADIPSDHELWNETDLRWAEGLQVRLKVAFAGSGEIVVRGRACGVLDRECRRCLRGVETDVDEELTVVFVGDSGAQDDDEGETYAFDAGGPDLQLGRAVRDELILATNPYVVCEPECRGLCASCGTDLNEGECDCTEDEIDPRWEALRVSKNE